MFDPKMRLSKFLLFLNANGISYEVCKMLKGERLMNKIGTATDDLLCLLYIMFFQDAKSKLGTSIYVHMNYGHEMFNCQIKMNLCLGTSLVSYHNQCILSHVLVHGHLNKYAIMIA